MSVVDRSGIKPSISCGFTAMVANKHVVSTPLQVFERNWISPVYVKAHSSPWFHDPRKWNTRRSPCQWRSPPRTRLSAKRNCSCSLKAIRKTVLFPPWLSRTIVVARVTPKIGAPREWYCSTALYTRFRRASHSLNREHYSRFNCIVHKK